MSNYRRLIVCLEGEDNNEEKIYFQKIEEIKKGEHTLEESNNIKLKNLDIQFHAFHFDPSTKEKTTSKIKAMIESFMDNEYDDCIVFIDGDEKDQLAKAKLLYKKFEEDLNRVCKGDIRFLELEPWFSFTHFIMLHKTEYDKNWINQNSQEKEREWKSKLGSKHKKRRWLNANLVNIIIDGYDKAILSCEKNELKIKDLFER